MKRRGTHLGPMEHGFTLLSEEDLYLFNKGNHVCLYQVLGAHPVSWDGTEGVQFAVWAPNAVEVSVVGDFNGWDRLAHPLDSRGPSGVWEGFVPGVAVGALYKFHIRSQHQAYRVNKADPLGFQHEVPPGTASVVRDLSYTWGDGAWMAERRSKNALGSPWSIYEVHLGSWMRSLEQGERFPGYRELAPRLAEYVRDLGFTHVELLPVMEHPFYGSWGYQVTGYFAPTSRYGIPQDFMFLVDTLHQYGIGVILDWVPSHYPADEHGLGFFDGTHLYEHGDPRLGYHPDWDSLIFNYGRDEVRSFLLSSAMFWLDRYHVDGLRVDGVASMLYLDYSRKDGEWIPNRYGGNENLEAILFLRRLNQEVYKHHSDVQTMAEESTAWPQVSRAVHVGGLGFGMKWDMGWMNDMLAYMAEDPVHRRFHHHKLTFRLMYAFQENFVLPLSHDEVVHGKGSLLAKMPGDDWQQRANLRLLMGYMYGQPGKKLLFMGGELGQRREWDHERSLDWHLCDEPAHRGIQAWVGDLNALLCAEPALYERDFEPEGFEWVDYSDVESCVVSFLRRGRTSQEPLLGVYNFTPVVRHGYRVGVPQGGNWRVVLNSDAVVYGGGGVGNSSDVEATATSVHSRPYCLELTLPPLAVLFLKPQP
ncbi:MAG: 1,4-alpha-glucan branching protein GlgB [Candidatus Bipolaricaulota bacterium]